MKTIKFLIGIALTLIVFNVNAQFTQEQIYANTPYKFQGMNGNIGYFIKVASPYIKNKYQSQITETDRKSRMPRGIITKYLDYDYIYNRPKIWGTNEQYNHYTAMTKTLFRFDGCDTTVEISTKYNMIPDYDLMWNITGSTSTPTEFINEELTNGSHYQKAVFQNYGSAVFANVNGNWVQRGHTILPMKHVFERTTNDNYKYPNKTNDKYCKISNSCRVFSWDENGTEFLYGVDTLVYSGYNSGYYEYTVYNYKYGANNTLIKCGEVISKYDNATNSTSICYYDANGNIYYKKLTDITHLNDIANSVSYQATLDPITNTLRPMPVRKIINLQETAYNICYDYDPYFYTGADSYDIALSKKTATNAELHSDDYMTDEYMIDENLDRCLGNFYDIYESYKNGVTTVYNKYFYFDDAEKSALYPHLTIYHSKELNSYATITGVKTLYTYDQNTGAETVVNKDNTITVTVDNYNSKVDIYFNVGGHAEFFGAILQTSNGALVSMTMKHTITVNNGNYDLPYNTVCDFWGVGTETVTIIAPNGNKYDYTVQWHPDLTDVDSNATAVEENNTAGISITPNPVVNNLNINGINGQVIVEVYGISGNRVKSVTTQGVVSLSDLPQGLYLVKVLQNGEVLTTQNIVKK